jgi:hypothetical protein
MFVVAIGFVVLASGTIFMVALMVRGLIWGP